MNNDKSINFEALVEAKAIAVEFYTLFKAQGLTPKGLDRIAAKINPDNIGALKKAFKEINVRLSGENVGNTNKIPVVNIPKSYGQPSFSELKNELKHLMSDYNFNNKITVPANFEFNGTSIPEIAQEWLGNPFDKQLEVPGLVHDYLYSTKSKKLHYSKDTADLAFYQLLKRNKVPESKAMVMYMGVVIGGHFFYMKD